MFIIVNYKIGFLRKLYRGFLLWNVVCIIGYVYFYYIIIDIFCNEFNINV